MVNVIGDIAGQYDCFLRLLKKMPDEEVLSVGDMIDRGPKSKEVVEMSGLTWVIMVTTR